jgi:hypothetical protein
LGLLFLAEMRFAVLKRREYHIATLSAVCALVIACVLTPAGAKASSVTQTKTKKISTAKTTSSKNTHKHHKAAATSSRTAHRSAGTMQYAASKKSLKHKKKVRGQQKIDPERAQAIQQALIREHYLTGEPNGSWNADSEAAMRRYQADNGWQSKTVPDSRALIKLGLGPSKDHLLNPDSAMTTVPDPPKATSIPPTSNGPTPVAHSATSTPASDSSDPQ